VGTGDHRGANPVRRRSAESHGGIRERARLIADANYKSIALEALRQVQDALNDVAAQHNEIVHYEQATPRFSRNRYEHGYVSYFEVVNSNRGALNIQRALIRSRKAQAAATIALVRVLGGGGCGAVPRRPGNCASLRNSRP
jgi:outer membrane protein, multidrug efflux system